MNFKEVKNLIESRKSTYPRQLTGEKINNETIEQLLDLARWAPTHHCTQPWRFKAFSGAALERVVDFQKEFYLQNTAPELQKPQKIEKYTEVKSKVSHLIAVVMERDELDRIPEWEEVASLAMAVQNIYLGMNALGVAGYWSTGNGTKKAEMEEYLGLSAQQSLMGWFYLGVRDASLPEGRRLRKPLSEVISLER